MPHAADPIDAALARLRAGGGDADDRWRVVEAVFERFRPRAAAAVRGKRDVRRWEQTGDVLAEAALRLHRALETVRPDHARGLFGLMAKKVREVALDFVDKHTGAGGFAGNHATGPGGTAGGSVPGAISAAATETSTPHVLAEWAEFHAAADRLPSDLREVWDLRFYAGLSEQEVSDRLGGGRANGPAAVPGREALARRARAGPTAAGQAAVKPEDTSLLTRWERAGRPDPDAFLSSLDAPLPDPDAREFRRDAAAVRVFGDTGCDIGDTAVAPAKEPAPPVPPDGYRLGVVIGSGGAGAVWSATSPGGNACAVKFTPRTGPLADDEVRGLELLRDVNHPHVIRVYAFWVRPGDVVIAMERATGSLLDLIADQPAGVPAGRILKLFEDAADGLDFMNDRGVRHCDVKPHNLFWIDSGRQVGAGGHERGVVADFGIAQRTDNQITARYGASTVGYTAPEAIAGQIHAHSDQWSLALSWLHLRAGRLPNRAQRSDVQRALAELSRRERSAVRRALREEPDERWDSCGEFVRRVRAAGEPRRGLGRLAVACLAAFLGFGAGVLVGHRLW